MTGLHPLTDTQTKALARLAAAMDDEALWQTILAFQSYSFFTATGLPFSYTVKVGRDGRYNKELLIDRRENSKTLTWGSIRLAFSHALEQRGQVIPKPKALGDIRGVSYVYPLLWQFQIICVPEQLARKMSGEEKKAACRNRL